MCRLQYQANRSKTTWTRRNLVRTERRNRTCLPMGPQSRGVQVPFRAPNEASVKNGLERHGESHREDSRAPDRRGHQTEKRALGRLGNDRRRARRWSNLEDPYFLCDDVSTAAKRTKVEPLCGVAETVPPGGDTALQRELTPPYVWAPRRLDSSDGCLRKGLRALSSRLRFPWAAFCSGSIFYNGFNNIPRFLVRVFATAKTIPIRVAFRFAPPPPARQFLAGSDCPRGFEKSLPPSGHCVAARLTTSACNDERSSFTSVGRAIRVCR